MADSAGQCAGRVAIVGAGMAGLACADVLAAAGCSVTLFDKGRRPGGRVSSLRLAGDSWDFGAPFVRVRNPDFARQVKLWRKGGLVQDWTAGPPGAVVGVPAMGTIIEQLSLAHDVRFAALVHQAQLQRDGWHLAGPDLAAGPFAALIVAVPAEQAAALLSLLDLGMAREAATLRSQSRWSAMLGFDQALGGVPDYLQDCGDLFWAARESSKPGRGPAENWVLHAGSDWSARYLERDPAEVAPLMLRLFAEATGKELPPPRFLKAHRWRFACPFGQRGTVLWNPLLRVGACGDWCLAPGIEGAWLAGRELAARALAALAADRALELAD